MSTTSKLLRVGGVLYLVTIHTLVLCAVFRPALLAPFQDMFGQARRANNFVADMFAYHARMDASVPRGADIFFGDSITQSLATAAVSPRAINYGIGTLDSAQLLAALPAYQSVKRANTLYLAIGTNDFLSGRQAGLDLRMRGIAALLPLGTPVVWSSIMPIAGKHASSAEIMAINRRIRELCSGRPRCIFVDTWALLTSADGRAAGIFFLRDGIHLSETGYAAWIGGLRAAASAVSSPADASAIPSAAQ